MTSPRTLYHVAPASLHETILREGLRVPEARNYPHSPPGIYLLPCLDTARDWADSELHHSERLEEPVEIWQVDVQGLAVESDVVWASEEDGEAYFLPGGRVEPARLQSVEIMVASPEQRHGQHERPLPTILYHWTDASNIPKIKAGGQLDGPVYLTRDGHPPGEGGECWNQNIFWMANPVCLAIDLTRLDLDALARDHGSCELDEDIAYQIEDHGYDLQTLTAQQSMYWFGNVCYEKPISLDAVIGLQAHLAPRSWKCESPVGLTREGHLELFASDYLHDQATLVQEMPLAQLLVHRGGWHGAQYNVQNGRSTQSAGLPITVAQHPEAPGSYCVVDGYHRLAAAVHEGEKIMVVHVQQSAEQLDALSELVSAADAQELQRWAPRLSNEMPTRAESPAPVRAELSLD